VQVEPAPDPVQPLVEEGNRQYAKMHWTGWTRAIAAYDKALALREDAPVRRRLVLAWLLRLVREMELQHVDPALLEPLRKAAEPLTQSEYIDLAVYRTLLDCYFKMVASPDRMDRWEERMTLFLGTPLPERKPVPEEWFLRMTFWDHQNRRDNRSNPDRDEFFAAFPDHPLSRFMKFGHMTLAEIETVLAADPEFYEVRLRRADDLLDQKKLSAALDEFETIALHLPFWTHIHLERGRLWLYLDEDEKALDAYTAALATDPDNGKAFFGKGTALTEMNRLEDAIVVFQEMLGKQMAFHGEAHYQLARSYFALGNPLESRREVDLARSYMPDSVDAAMLSGILHLSAGDVAKAKPDFLAVLFKANTNGDAHYFLAQIAWLEKRKKDVPVLLDKALAGFKTDMAGLEMRLAENVSSDLSQNLRERRQAKLNRKLRLLIEQTAQRLELAQSWLVSANQKRRFLREKEELLGRLAGIAAGDGK